ncbi:MAG: hypothetical protein CM15mV48_880 [uncultured marine virus]|nr:MAG: hypothetical protein CM15mV48_880 [uncultured marine virus]
MTKYNKTLKADDEIKISMKVMYSRHFKIHSMF